LSSGAIQRTWLLQRSRSPSARSHLAHFTQTRIPIAATLGLKMGSHQWWPQDLEWASLCLWPDGFLSENQIDSEKVEGERESAPEQSIVSQYLISQMLFSYFYLLLNWKNCVSGSWDRPENNIHHIAKVLFVNSKDIKWIHNVSEGEILQEKWFKNCDPNVPEKRQKDVQTSQNHEQEYQSFSSSCFSDVNSVHFENHTHEIHLENWRINAWFSLDETKMDWIGFEMNYFRNVAIYRNRSFDMIWICELDCASR
jgi:hypothetical protein